MTPEMWGALAMAAGLGIALVVRLDEYLTRYYRDTGGRDGVD